MASTSEFVRCGKADTHRATGNQDAIHWLETKECRR